MEDREYTHVSYYNPVDYDEDEYDYYTSAKNAADVVDWAVWKYGIEYFRAEDEYYSYKDSEFFHGFYSDGAEVDQNDIRIYVALKVDSLKTRLGQAQARFDAASRDEGAAEEEATRLSKEYQETVDRLNVIRGEKDEALKVLRLQERVNSGHCLKLVEEV